MRRIHAGREGGPGEETMPKIEIPDVGDLVDAIRQGVKRRLGKKRRLRSGEDLIEDVGLTADQFDDLIGELEGRFGVEIDPDTWDHLTVAGALLVRLITLCSREADEEERAVA